MDEVKDVMVTGKDLVGNQQQAGLANQIFAETHAAVLLAKQFPRIYTVSWGRMQEMCRRKTLAAKAEYSYPRGGKQIKGGSVYLARPLAGCWHNVHSGIRIISNQEDEIIIQGWAWDLETNDRKSFDKPVRKLIQRKVDGKSTWIKPDERDLGELVNREGAKLLRNAIFAVIPTDFVEDAIAMCRETLTKDIKDPRSASKELIKDFMDKYGIKVESLNVYIGTEDWSPEQIVDLQVVLNTINDGEAKPSAYFSTKPQVKTRKKTTIKKMKAGDSKKHQSVKGKADKKKPEPKKEELPEAPTDNTKAITEILALVKKNEAAMSGRLLKQCLKSNLEIMSPDGLRIVRIDVDDAIDEAVRIAAAAK